MKRNRRKPNKEKTRYETKTHRAEEWFDPLNGEAKWRLNGKGNHASILSDEDFSQLLELEKLIPGGKTVFDRGRALRTIKRRGLYRHYGDGCLAFEKCVDQWGIGEKYALKLIKASSVFDDLQGMADVVMPKNEAQVRHLAPFNCSQRRLLWKRVVDDGGRITEKLVKKIVEEFKCGFSSPRRVQRNIKLNQEAIRRLQRYAGYAMHALENENTESAKELLKSMTAQLSGNESLPPEPEYEI